MQMPQRLKFLLLALLLLAGTWQAYAGIAAAAAEMVPVTLLRGSPINGGNWSGPCHALVYSPDGRTLASTMHNTINVWDAASGSLLRTAAHEYVNSLAYSPDGRRLASGGLDTTIKLWDAASGSLLRTLENTNYVLSLAYSPDGRTLASGFYDNTVKVWPLTQDDVLCQYVPGNTGSQRPGYAPATANLSPAQSPTSAGEGADSRQKRMREQTPAPKPVASQEMTSSFRQQAQPTNRPIENPTPVIRSVQVVPTGRQGSAIIPGKSYALLIATNKYDPQFPQLSNPIQDARDIETMLRNYYGWNTKLLVNPKRTEILETLEEYSNRSYNPEDQLFIYLAGHGQFDNASHDGVIVATDSQPNDKLKDTYIPYSRLKSIIDRGNCNKVLLALDVCFGGTFLESLARQTRDVGSGDIYARVSLEKVLQEIKNKQARKLVTSGGNVPVYDGAPGHHSPFAFNLLRALRSAGGEKGYLRFYDFEQVARSTQPGGVATAFSENDDPLGDFLFVPVPQVTAP